jgi:DNA-binding NarL/FixJ family response regulator
LVLTAARRPDLRAWVRSLGADEMISKDASVEEILAAMRLLVRG